MLRQVKYLEKTYYHSYKYDRFDPPLKIITVGVSRWGPGDSFGRKDSSVFSVNLVTYGSAVFEQDGVSYAVGCGEVFMPRKGCNHHFRTGPEGFLHKRFMLIDGPLLGLYLRTMELDTADRLVPRSGQYLAGLFREAYRVMQGKGPAFSARLSQIAFAVLLHLGESAAPEHPREIRRIIEYMKRHLDTPLELRGLCDKAGISMRQCNRLFRRHLTTTPMAFFAGQRISWAVNLLESTPMSIKEIAAVVGFDDPLYFSTAFRRHIGLSPQQYRATHVQARQKRAGGESALQT
jgi:AraC-like DNA-binding protein